MLIQVFWRFTLALVKVVLVKRIELIPWWSQYSCANEGIFLLHPFSRTRKLLDPLFRLIIVEVSFCPRRLEDTTSERQMSCLSRWVTAKYPWSLWRGWVQLLTPHQVSPTKANLPTLAKMGAKAWCLSIPELGVFGTKLCWASGVLLSPVDIE